MIQIVSSPTYRQPPSLTPISKLPNGYNLRGKTIVIHPSGLKPPTTFAVAFIMDGNSDIRYFIGSFLSNDIGVDNIIGVIQADYGDIFTPVLTAATLEGWTSELSFTLPNDQDYTLYSEIEPSLSSQLSTDEFWGWDLGFIVEDNPDTSFDYNVVGVLSTVSYRFRSVQAKMNKITQQEQWALLSLRENINDYLSKVATISGRNPQVYLEDTVDGLYNYTGSYEVAEIKTDISGNTQILIKAIGNDSPTFYGLKDFPNDNTSQLVYQYRNRMTYEVYDVTPINGFSKNVLLTTRRQQLSASGYNAFNISELAKGYVAETGGVAIKVVVTSTDYFANTDTVTTDPCTLVQARVPEINYGTYILFNPKTGGEILPTTGYQLLYNNSEVYPFYVNFITNSLMGAEGVAMQMKIQLFQKDTLLDTQFISIPTTVGLNIVDLAQYPNLTNSIIARKPTTIKVEVLYRTTISGEFTSEFNSEFDVGAIGGSGQSTAHTISCRHYVLDNRRDFYFSYQNGIGGISTYLCNEYRRITEPEIVAMRNASSISNSVARETESIELTFKYVDLKGLNFLLGYSIDSLLKYDGIFESQNIQRIGSGDIRLPWIIKGSSYDLSNSTLYKDIIMTIYRPLGMIPDEK